MTNTIATLKQQSDSPVAASGATGEGPLNEPKDDSTKKKPKNAKGRPEGHPPGMMNAKRLDPNNPLVQQSKWFDGDPDDPLNMYGPDYGDYGKLDQDDPRAAYDPIGGLSGAGKACANCQWFQAAGNRCHVVEGTVLATGLSKLWMEKASAEEQAAVPVYIVGQDEKGAEKAPKTPEKIDLSTPVTGIEKKQKSFIDSLKDFFGIQSKPVKLFDTAMGFKTLDNGRWVAWWSNNFEDRHEEIFSEKAHDGYISALEKGDLPYPELWYRHLTIPSGRAEWVGRVDHMMLAAGSFYDTEVGRKFYTHFKNSPIEHTVSHGFLYSSKDFKDGIYSRYYTYEISPLLPGEEANPITGFGVKQMATMITDVKRADLEKIVGADLAAAYIQFGEEKSRELEALGVKFKEVGESAAPATPAVPAALDSLAQSQKDLAAGFKSLVDLSATLKANVDQLVARGVDQSQRLEKLETAFKELSTLAPRASRDQTTIINRDNPYLNYLGTKTMEQDKTENSAKQLGVLGDIIQMATKQAGA